jgi:GxxExxY protein
VKIDLLYPELSYKIVGCAYEVYNEIGDSHKERTYHNAMAVSFQKAGISAKSELYYPVKFGEVTVGKNYFDFLVDDQIVVELKTSDRFTKAHFDQLQNYLLVSNIKLGLLIAFCTKEVKFKRVLNISLLNKEKQQLKTN